MHSTSLAGNPKPATLEEARARREHYVSITKSLDWEDRPASGGYSTNEMWVVFKKVANPENWKMPVDWTGELTKEELAILQYAVTEFTGGGMSYTPNWSKGDNVYRVKAPGYYANIGA